MAEQKNPQAQPELSLSEQTRIRREKRRSAIRLSRTEMQSEKTHWPIPKVHSKAWRMM